VGERLIVPVRCPIDLRQPRLAAPWAYGSFCRVCQPRDRSFGIVIALLEHVHRSHVIQDGSGILRIIELLVQLWRIGIVNALFLFLTEFSLAHPGYNAVSSCTTVYYNQELWKPKAVKREDATLRPAKEGIAIRVPPIISKSVFRLAQLQLKKNCELSPSRTKLTLSPEVTVNLAHAVEFG
jgi:hypothetical protein